MFRAGYVIRTAAMQVAIRVGLFVQREGVSPPQHLCDHPLVLRFGSVAVHHAFRLRQFCRFVDPGFQWSCHADPPTGPIFRRHTDQSETPRPLWGAGDTLEEDPDQVRALERLDSAKPAGPCKGGNFRPGWQAFCFYPPQSMLPLSTHASWLLFGRCHLVQTACDGSGHLVRSSVRYFVGSPLL